MTDAPDTPVVPTLSPTARKFVLHWGEMGARWGINRSVAQVHAVLYASPEPLNAEQVSELLSLARSNVSTSLKELQAWGVITVLHKFGDRRDYFQAIGDAWEMLRAIARERKRRELDPTIDFLESCSREARSAGRRDEHLRQRLDGMLDVFSTLSESFDSLEKLPTTAIARVARMGSRAWKLLKLA